MKGLEVVKSEMESSKGTERIKVRDKFSREFGSLVRVKSEFTGIFPSNSRENLTERCLVSERKN